MPSKYSTLALTKEKAKTYAIGLLIAACVLMPLETLHLLAVLAHTFYESIAYGLEHLLIHSLSISKFQAQILVFYLSLAIGFGLGYAIIRRIPRGLATLRDLTTQKMRQSHSDLREKWHTLPNRRKFQLMTINTLCLAGSMMFLLA